MVIQTSLTRFAFDIESWNHYAAYLRHANISTEKTVYLAYLAFGFFAAYLERDCLRSFTPCKSSDPRTMW